MKKAHGLRRYFYEYLFYKAVEQARKQSGEIVPISQTKTIRARVDELLAQRGTVLVDPALGVTDCLTAIDAAFSEKVRDYEPQFGDHSPRDERYQALQREFTRATGVGAQAFACAAPLAQAIGRLRCLVQGCCHGRPVFSALGLCVRHPRSRVAALSHLRGVPIHPTQLYSIVGNLCIFAVLWRMWQAHAPGTCIAGLYLVLASLARFAEEQYRGEVQTRTLAGLAIYQWLALGMCVAGMAVSAWPAAPVYQAAQWGWASAALAVAGGAVAAFLMSVDFPQSRARFSRLTVDETAP